jgi:hypothetical protein
MSQSPPKNTAQPAKMPRNDSAVAGRLAGGLLDEVERDRADQHACAEAHDQPDQGQADAKEKSDKAADHE